MRHFVCFFMVWAVLLADACLAQTVVSPVNYTVAGSLYTQNFDGLPASGTFTLSGKGPFNLGGNPINATNLTGWQVLMSAGSNTSAAFAVGTGSSTGNAVYSFGAAASTDRALGSLSSGTGIYAMGMVLTNQTGNLLNSFTVSFTAEQWRKGGSSNKNTWSFHYKTGLITHLDQTGMQDEQNLNFSSVVTTASATSLNGNLPENRQTVSYTLTGISWKAGEQLLLRWDDADETGSDDAVGIDNFSFSAVLNSSAPAIINQSVITVTANSAQLSATVNDNYAGTAVLFEYDTVNTFSKAISIHPVPDTILAGSGNTNVLANFSGLLSGTNYYFRIKAKNTNGLVISAIQNFITKVSLPSVSTIAAVNILTSSAILGGNVSTEGGAAVIEKGIVWSLGTGPTLLNNKIVMGSGPGIFSQPVSGLPEGSILFARAYAINSAGVSYGDTVRLVTQTEINFLNTVTFGKINIATASFTFKTAQPVTGLSAQNFSLTTTGISNAFITSISGAESAFTITVNTGSGDGTVGLNFVNDIGLSIPVYNKPFFSANNYVVDKSPPQINRISIPNTPMKTGDTVPVSILVKPDHDIYKLVTGNINGLGLSGFIKNNDSAYAAYFVIANGGNDVDASADIPLSVVLTDSIGNNSLPFTQAISQSSDAVDANKPVIISIQNPPNGIYKSGDTLFFLIRFSEKIMVTPTGIPSITLTVGTRSRTAIYQTGSGSDSLLFRYIIANGDKDLDGIKTAGTITLNNAVIKDPIGNTAAVGFNNTLATKQVLIDAVVPVVNSITVPVAGIYKTGNVLDFILNLSKKVWVDETGRPPSLTIAIGSMQKVAQYINGTGSNALLFRYTIQTGDRDADGIKLISPLTDSNFVTRDSVGNKALLTLNSIGSMASVQINPPTILLNRVIVPEEGIYKTGDTLEILVDYSERVFVTGIPYLKITIGSSSKQAVFTNGSGSNTLSFIYIVQPGDEDTDGIRIASSITVSNGSIKDGQSNIAPVILNNMGDVSRVLVDAVAADIKAVALPEKGLYKSGDTLDFIFRFTEKIKTAAAISSSTLSLTIGTKTVFANCTGNNVSDSLVYRYIIQNGDFDKDGIRMASFINYNNTVIKDLAGNGSTPAFTAISAKKILVDAIAPFFKTVSLPSTGTYTTGASLDFMVSYSENVFVSTGTNLPFICINLRDSIRKAMYINGSGTNSLLFRYSIQKEDRDSAGTIRLVSPTNDFYSSVKDSAGNSLLQGFISTEKSGGFHINPPIIKTDKVMVPVQGMYKKEDTLKFSIQYADKIFVDPKDGIPVLKILIGNSEKKAAYTEGSGTNRLTFIYTIQPDDEDKDGLEINPSTSFNNAVIKDAEGNPALTFLNNIGNIKEVIIDGVAPAIKAVILPVNRTYKENDTLQFTVKFTETIWAVSTINTATISLTIGTKEKTAIYANGNGTDSLVFRYIIQAGELDKDGIKITSPVNLNGTFIRDSAGNIGSATFTPPSTKNILIDAAAPVVSGVLVPVPGIYQTGNSLDFTVIFSKKVFVSAGDRFPFLSISLAKKTVNALYRNGSGTNSLVFGYTIQPEDRDSLGIRLTSSLTDFNFLIRDTVGNKLVTLLNNTGITSGIIINPPVISIVKVIIPPPGLFKSGDTLNYFINYSDTVFVSTKAGIPFLKTDIGSFSKQAMYIGGSGSNLLQFRYIIQSGDEDRDGIELSPGLSLNNGTIKDIEGNTALTYLNNIPDTRGIIVDGIAPTIKTITVPVDNTYKEGDTLLFILRFTEKIRATATLNTSAISLTIGSKTQTAIYTSGIGTDSLVYRHIIQAGELDKDGITITSPVNLNGVIIQDNAGNNGSVSFTPPSTKNILIDAIAPVINGVLVPVAGIYHTGNSLDFTVIFSKKVFVLPGERIPVLSISLAKKTVNAMYTNRSGTNGLRFRYTIQSDDRDSIGIRLATALTDFDSLIRDTVGNKAIALLKNTGITSGIVINLPMIGIDKITAPPAALYKTGDTLNYFISYHQNVFVSTKEGIPSLKINIGLFSKPALYVSGSGSNRLLFRYIIQTGDEDKDGIETNPNLSLNNGTIKDAEENVALTNLTNVPDTKGVFIDGIAPSIKSIIVPADKTYKEGDTLHFIIKFTEIIQATSSINTAAISLTIGTKTQPAIYTMGNGTDSLVFSYIIQAGEMDKDGIKITSPIILNGAIIKDIAGNIGSDVFNPPSTKNILIDAIAPVVNSIRVPLSGTYKTGNSLDFSVTFSKKVWVNTITGNPFLSISIGSKSVKAFYANGSGTNTVLFRYTIQSDDIDTDGITLNPLIKDTNKSITDSAGNRLINVLINTGFMPAIYINPPETNIIRITVPKNGLYKAGDTLQFTIDFSGKANLSSSAVKPFIRVDIGTASKTAQYTNGSGTNTWIFTYIIQPGDEAINGIQMASSISLNSGSIKDERGNSVSLVLPDKGNTGAILVDAISPIITNLSAPEKHNYTSGDTLELVITFSEPVFILPKADQPYIKLTIGNTQRNMLFSSGSGSNQFTFRYMIQTGDLDKNGMGIGSLIIPNNNPMTDLAGNTAATTYKTTNPFTGYIIDAVSPAFIAGNTETIDVCENSPAFNISKLLAVTDSENGERLTWTIQNNPKYGSLSVNTITANSNGKNLTPSSLDYRSLVNHSGVDTILIRISDGINTSQKSILVNIQPALQNNEISSPQTICFNYVPAIINGTKPQGGNGNYQYSWESSALSASLGFSNVNGADTYAYLPTALNNTTWFRRKIVSGACYDTSKPIKITVVKNGLWLGSSNNNWHDQNNWCGISIPTNTTDVLINPNTLYEPIVKDTARCNHITIADKRHLVISGILQVSGDIKTEKTIQAEMGTILFNGTSEQKLNGTVFENRSVKNIIINNPSGVSITDSINLTGTLVQNAGILFTNDLLTLKHTASIGPAALGTNVSGNIFIEHLIKGGRRVFWLLGHPFADTLGLQMLRDSLDITGNNGLLNGFTTTLTNQPSAFRYDIFAGNDSTGIETGWIPFTNTNGLADNTWERHKGIKLLVRGKPGQGLDGIPAGDGKNGTYLPQPVIIKLSGKINTGDQELSLLKDKYARYHVVANPYAANIDLSNITRGKDIATNYWLWNPQQGINGGYTSFPFRSKNIMAPFGAFIAKATGNNYNKLFFTENVKTITPVSDGIATVNLDDIFYVELRMESDSIFWDRIVLLAMDSAKTFIDKNDAEKFMNNDVNFYSISKENKLLSIDARPVNNESTINLGIQTEEPRIFRIRMAKSVLPPSSTLLLHDKYLDKWTAMIQDSSYLFYTTNDTASQGNERFEITSRKKKTDTVVSKPAMTVKANPVPARDKIVVDYVAAEPGTTFIRILSLSGMPLKTISLGIQKQGQVTIPVGDLLRGIYLLELTCGSETSTQKIIKD